MGLHGVCKLKKYCDAPSKMTANDICMSSRVMTTDSNSPDSKSESGGSENRRRFGLPYRTQLFQKRDGSIY